MFIKEACGVNLNFVAGREPYHYQGWNSAWGEEIIHKHLVARIGNGDTVLDLGSGWGRGSLPLAMYGARITAVDRDPENEITKTFTETGLLPQLARVITADFHTLTPEMVGKFNFVMAVQAFVHMPKSEALKFIERIVSFTLRGGLIYLDAASTLSEEYVYYAQYEEPIDKDTYEVPCGYSGEISLEPHAFYHPGEIDTILKQQGARILVAQHIPANSVGNLQWTVIAQV